MDTPTALITLTDQQLSTVAALDQNPAAVYLAGLTSEKSRITIRGALGVVADLLLPDQFTPPDRKASREARQTYHNRCLLVPWAALRFQHSSYPGAVVGAVTNRPQSTRCCLPCAAC
jgi:hypothetical protein